MTNDSIGGLVDVSTEQEETIVILTKSLTIITLKLLI